MIAANLAHAAFSAGVLTCVCLHVAPQLLPHTLSLCMCMCGESHRHSAGGGQMGERTAAPSTHTPQVTATHPSPGLKLPAHRLTGTCRGMPLSQMISRGTHGDLHKYNRCHPFSFASPSSPLFYFGWVSPCNLSL